MLSYIVAMERTRTRIWHGELREDVAAQPDYLEPNAWAAFFERLTQKTVKAKGADDGVLLRKVRAQENFSEYVPLGLLFLVALELMQAQAWLLWLLGVSLTVARITHAYGVIQVYGPSPGRAIGFFLTWFVYLIGAGACLYYSLQGLLL